MIPRLQVVAIGIAAAFSAAVSYVVLLIAAQSLSAAENALFLVYWALLFGLFGVFSGVHAEATRAVADAREISRGAAPPVVALATSFAGVVTTVLAVSAVFWSDKILDADRAWLLYVVAAAGCSFSAQLAVAGILTGSGRWRSLLVLMLLEAGLRLVLVAIMAVRGGSVVDLSLASALPAAAWLLLLGRRDIQDALRVRAARRVAAQLRNLIAACAASASSTTLVVGFPVLLRLTTSDAEFRASAGLMLAVTVTRAPLLVPLNAYQGIVVRHFQSRSYDQSLGPLRVFMWPVLAVTLVAATVVYAVGPRLFRLAFGDAYDAGAALLAILTVAAGLLAVLTVTGACCLAREQHLASAAGWLAAIGTALALLLIAPAELITRAALSLVVAPLVGCTAHLVALHRAGEAAPPHEPDN